MDIFEIRFDNLLILLKEPGLGKDFFSRIFDVENPLRSDLIQYFPLLLATEKYNPSIINQDYDNIALETEDTRRTVEDPSLSLLSYSLKAYENLKSKTIRDIINQLEVEFNHYLMIKFSTIYLDDLFIRLLILVYFLLLIIVSLPPTIRDATNSKISSNSPKKSQQQSFQQPISYSSSPLVGIRKLSTISRSLSRSTSLLNLSFQDSSSISSSSK